MAEYKVHLNKKNKAISFVKKDGMGMVIFVPLDTAEEEIRRWIGFHNGEYIREVDKRGRLIRWIPVEVQLEKK